MKNVIDYRRRLSDAYVSTHFAAIRQPSLDAIERTFPYFRHHFLPHLPPDPASLILDAGCGYGALIFALRQHGYANTVGVDISPEQVELARQLGIDGIQLADAGSHLRSNPGRYDAIFALDLLEHLTKENLIQMVDGVAEALRPGGTFIVQTVNAESPFGGRAMYRDFTHEQAFTSTSIAQVLRLGGFQTVAVHPVEPAVHGISSAVRWLLWQGIRSLLAFYLAVETGAVRGHIFSQNLIAVAVKPTGGAR